MTVKEFIGTFPGTAALWAAIMFAAYVILSGL